MSQLTGYSQSFGQNLFVQSATSQAVLGDLATTSDGRKFRYAKVGAVDLVAGNLIQAPALVANHQNLTCAVTAAGALQVTVTLGATLASANQYTGGLLVINAGPGIGQTLRIASNPAAALNTAVVLTLEDSVQVSLTGASRACLIPAPFNGVIQQPTTPTAATVGVAISNLVAGQFGWIQTGGITSALSDVNIAAVGLSVMPSTTTAGAVTVGTATGAQIGMAVESGVSAEARAVYLTL